MFHGCKMEANESAIVQQGFRVELCKSGGSGFGTWFAYNAQYSDNGYAIVDAACWKHLFVCLVSKHDVKRDDNSTMRLFVPTVDSGVQVAAWVAASARAHARFCLKVATPRRE